VVAVGAAFAVFAAPGVAAKESAEMAIVVATAIVEIVFMFGLPSTGFRCAEHARRTREYNLINFHLWRACAGSKPKPETREAVMHVRVRPSVKAAAERRAQEDGRSLANWLERLIEAEAARRDGKK
jgi:hypothetical protein